VEEGIEIGKKMMAEMIANYPTPTKPSAAVGQSGNGKSSPSQSNGRDYLNEVSRLSVRASENPEV
jgi:hypothetical protein